MVSETVKKVLLAESESDKLVSDAKLRCDEITAQANEYSQRLKDERLCAAEEECEKIRAENQSLIEELRRNSSQDLERQKERIMREAQDNADIAVKAVMDSLLGAGGKDGD